MVWLWYQYDPPDPDETMIVTQNKIYRLMLVTILRIWFLAVVQGVGHTYHNVTDYLLNAMYYKIPRDETMKQFI